MGGGQTRPILKTPPPPPLFRRCLAVALMGLGLPPYRHLASWSYSTTRHEADLHPMRTEQVPAEPPVGTAPTSSRLQSGGFVYDRRRAGGGEVRRRPRYCACTWQASYRAPPSFRASPGRAFIPLSGWRTTIHPNVQSEVRDFTRASCVALRRAGGMFSSAHTRRSNYSLAQVVQFVKLPLDSN